MAVNVIVFDFETTGLSVGNGDRAIEVAAVVVDEGVIVDQFQSLMNPGGVIPPLENHCSGITEEMVKGAPPSHEVMKEFHKFIGKKQLIAHRAPFDRVFLDFEFSIAGVIRVQDICCSMLIARRIYPKLFDHKLETLIEYSKVETEGEFHRALNDATMTARLWLQMVSELQRRFGLDSVSMQLMSEIQKIPTKSLQNYMGRRTKPL